MVHRLKGDPFYLNTDLIESMEATPDTVITLIDSRRLVVADTPEEIVDRIRVYRSSLLVSADQMLQEAPSHLTVIDGGDG